MAKDCPAQRYKELQGSLDSPHKDMDKLLFQKAGVDKKIYFVSRKIEEFESKLKSLAATAMEPIISDHAILRYLERVKKVDIEGVKKEILNDDLKKLIQTLDSGKFPSHGFTAVVRDKTIITIVTPEDE